MTWMNLAAGGFPLYLDHRAVFDEAYGFYVLEKTDNLHALVGEEPVPCAPTAEQIDRFKERLRTTLHGETEGQRLRVEVEALRRLDRGAPPEIPPADSWIRD